MLDIEKKYVLKDNILLKSINDSFFALDTNIGTQYRLNRVSYDLLSSLDGRKKIIDVILYVASHYKIEEDVFRKDSIEFFDMAISKKIITEGEKYE